MELKKIIKSRELTVGLVMIGLIVFFSLSSERFLTTNNIKNILLQVSSIGVASIGMTMIIITGGIDVSAGSILGIVAVTLGKAATNGFPAWLSIILGILVGLALGSVNASFIALLGIPPIIVTLGMMSLLRSLAYTFLGGRWIASLPGAVRWMGLGKILNVPVPIWLTIILVAYFSYFMRYRPLGRYIYAVGNSLEAARVSGVDTKRILFFVYALAGLMYGIAGAIVVGRAGIVQTNTGNNFELQVIAATVLGGTSILGGKGTIVGSILGSLLVAVLSNGLILLNVPALTEGLIIGVLILGSVAIDVIKNRGEE
ncbi:MAG: rhamnose transport system permease protein [Thermotogaceae bacterium]|jgi:ribose/xylose/arabinose/galactoside ABC-type transport system permease subunit|nr:rhamnose transport system permease protein [Thermotogaceae bacterium]MDN5337264.1 rhamnose transport system permease protein [Thermotogaceae bacterium]